MEHRGEAPCRWTRAFGRVRRGDPRRRAKQSYRRSGASPFSHFATPSRPRRGRRTARNQDGDVSQELVLSPRWRRGPVPRLPVLLWARGGSPSRLRTMGSVRIHPGVPPLALLRRNFAQALCRQSCARAPAARLRGGTGPPRLRCEAPAPGLQRGAISRLSRARTSKLAPLSAAAAAAAGAAAGADAAGGAARLSDSTRGARSGHLTRRAASRAAAIADRRWRWRLVAVVDL